MKICTITFHKVCNNGAVLQAYALMKHLMHEGHEVEIIDYQPIEVQKPYKIFFHKHNDTKNIFKIIARETISPIFRLKSRYNFIKFEKKYLKLTDKVYKDIDELKSNYPNADMYICGSDQIWNDEITGGIDEGYFLQFGSENIEKISYAASCGKKIHGENAEKMISYLKSFDGVSIREKETLSFFEKNNIETKVVLDPVFLLSKNQWQEVGKKRLVKDKYLLIYALCPGDELYISAKKIAKERKLKIVEISNKITNNKNADINFSFTGPEEFISLFVHSDFIVTNSFHGTAFSLILEKQFFSFPHKLIKERNVRVLNLLNTFELIDRFIDYGKIIDKETSLIQYKEVSKKFNVKVEESKNYLRKFYK